MRPKMQTAARWILGLFVCGVLLTVVAVLVGGCTDTARAATVRELKDTTSRLQAVHAELRAELQAETDANGADSPAAASLAEAIQKLEALQGQVTQVATAAGLIVREDGSIDAAAASKVLGGAVGGWEGVLLGALGPLAWGLVERWRAGRSKSALQSYADGIDQVSAAHPELNRLLLEAWPTVRKVLTPLARRVDDQAAT